MAINKHVLIYTEYGDTCDFKARVFGVYDTFEEAKTKLLKIYTNSFFLII